MLQDKIVKISILDFDTAYRILEKMNYGVISLKEDSIILNDVIEIKQCDETENGHWRVANLFESSPSKYFPNFLEAFESALIKSFMAKLSSALWDEKDYTKNSVDLSE